MTLADSSQYFLMFKFSKSVDKDQELEEGQLSDDGVDVVGYTIPVSIQPKPKLQDSLDQQSESQEYVFETIKIPEALERKKDRKELKIYEKNRQKQERWLTQSKSPESKNYQSVSSPNAYYPYPPQPHAYPQYPAPIDQRNVPFIPHPGHAGYPRQNYGQGEQYWDKQYQGYQYQMYPRNPYNVIPNIGSTLPHTSIPTMNLNGIRYNNPNQYPAHQHSGYPHMQNPSLGAINVGTPYNNSVYPINSNQIINDPSRKQPSLELKKRAYQEEKQAKKKARVQNIQKIRASIEQKTQQMLKYSAIKQKEIEISQHNQQKQQFEQILLIIKGVIQERENAGMKIGNQTLSILDLKLNRSEILRKTVYDILDIIQAQNILNQLKQRQIQRKILGNQKISKYNEIIKNIKRSQSDPRLRN